MKIPDLRLGNDESVLYALRTHPKIIIPRVMIGAILLAVSIWILVAMPAEKFDPRFSGTLQVLLACVGFYYSIWPIIQWASNKYIVTNRQIIVLEGVLLKKTHSSQLALISDINVERGILDRVFGCGTLIIFNSAGSIRDSNDTSRVRLHDVPKVLDIEHKIKDLVFKANV